MEDRSDQDKENTDSRSGTEVSSENQDVIEQSLTSSHQNYTTRGATSLTNTSTNSVLARQRVINQRYMLADPGKALETTNMNVFVDRSYLSTNAPG